MDEKIMILKMLEEGKITSDEALKLLGSLEVNKTAEKSPKNDYNEQQYSTNGKFNDTINRFSKKAEEFADKFGPDFISRAENISTDFTEAAVKFADKIVNYISGSFNNSEAHKTLSKNYSFPITNNEKVRVILKTQNLNVLASSTNNPEVSLNMKLNLFFEAIDIDRYVSTKYENEVICISTDFPERTWGTIEIQLPKDIASFEVETSNSKCFLDGLVGTGLNCSTSNGKVEVRNCSCEKLDAITYNGKIIIIDSKAACANIDTSNGSIELDSSSFDMLKSTTSNGSIYLTNFDSINAPDAEYMLQTSNGKVKINIPKKNNSGYKINARTSLGNVNIPELESSYIIDRRNGDMKAEASVTSRSLEAFAKRIFIEAKTSNSSINITND